MSYPISELAEAFRDPTPPEYQALKDDIKINGQQVPIAHKDGRIVDARQRGSILFELGITPWYQELPDHIDPARFLMAMHRKYRNLSANDLALAAAQLAARSRPGGDRKSEAYQICQDHSAHVHNDLTQQEAARSLGVSPRLVSQASRLLAEDSPAPPELKEAVRKGEVKIGDVYRVKDQPCEVQVRALARVRREQARTLTAAVREIAGSKPEGSSTAQPRGAYRTIVVDPPWPAEDSDRVPRSADERRGRAAMTVGEIAGMRLPLADDAFVFLWTTQAHMADAFKVLGAWGLTYRFTMIWQKGGGIQPPDSCRHDVELAVVGAKGEPKFAYDWRFSAIVHAPCENPLDRHSPRPKAFYDLLSKFTPGPKLELPEDCVKHWPVWEVINDN